MARNKAHGVSMKITCNGDERDIVAGTRLLDLICQLDLNPDTVVAEYNGRIIMRPDYDSHILEDGCRLELIRFVGGG